MTQTIVVPLDGSDLAERAIPWAATLARTLGQSITLVQVIPWPLRQRAGILDVYVSPELAEKIRVDSSAAAREYLERLCTDLKASGLDAHAEVAVGTVIETILDVADERGASTIVVASHGHGGLTRIMTGSVAQRLLQQALVPVMIVRSSAAAQASPQLNSILVPVDGSTLTESAIELATNLASASTTLVLARIVEPIEVPVTSGIEAAAVVDWRTTEEATRDAEQYLDTLSAALRKAGLQTKTVVRAGRIAQELRTVADDMQVDLIVMSTHGRTGFDRVMLGSVADDLARHAKQPVLMISARALTARMMGPFIVRDIMTRDIASVRDDEPLASVIRKLLRRRVSGAPVVNAEGVLVGVVSEHDIVAWHARFIAQSGNDESMLDPVGYQHRLEVEHAGAIMTSPAISIESDAPLTAAMHLLVSHRLRRLPVTHDGRLVGIITRSDALGAIERQENRVTAGATGSA